MAASGSDYVYHALLAGINAYLRAALGGCVNDSEHVEALLREKAPLSSNAEMHTIRPTDPRPGAFTGHEQSALPTRSNILGAPERP